MAQGLMIKSLPADIRSAAGDPAIGLGDDRPFSPQPSGSGIYSHFL
jgi:hypothetical protein